MRLPRKLTASQSEIATEWNAMVDYLRSLTPAQSAGQLVSHTSHGVTRTTIQPFSGSVLYVRVCTQAGDEYWIPFRVAGEPVLEADIPTGAAVYDPTP